MIMLSVLVEHFTVLRNTQDKYTLSNYHIIIVDLEASTLNFFCDAVCLDEITIATTSKIPIHF